ncbi:MAG: hypothetical protein AB7E13_02920 [Arcobacteraceae bacterium]
MQQNSLLYSSNFFDIFGIDNNGDFIARYNIKIYDDIYYEGFIFNKNMEYSNFFIAKMLNEIPLFYIEDYNTIDLKNFVPNGTTQEICINVKPEPILYRFGEKQWIEKAFNEGSFFIKPAISYISDTYDNARKDNEHLFEQNMMKEKNLNIHSSYCNSIKPISCKKVNFDMNINKYILCMSYCYDERLYTEFNVDACLIIHNPIEFEKRLTNALMEHNKNFAILGNRVSYSQIPHNLGILFSKTFTYSIQKEYRYLIYDATNPILVEQSDTNKDSFTTPQALKLNIGNLQDIAEIIYKNK